MTTYHVQLHRDVSVSFTDIEADSPHDAASIARRTPTGFADRIDDGDDLRATVTPAGSEDHRHGVAVEFAAGRLRNAAPALLAALEDLMADIQDLAREYAICDEIAKSGYGKAADAAITAAKALGEKTGA
jgi:hypothetical protein